MCIRVGRSATKAVVCARTIKFVTIEMPLIEIEVTAVCQTKIGSAGKHQWEIGVAMTVAVGHAATKK